MLWYIATPELLLCTLAGMWNPASTKNGQVQNYAMRFICSKPHSAQSEHLKRSLNWMHLLSKWWELFKLVLVHCCVHKQALTYLAECFQTEEGYGHVVTWKLKKCHLKLVITQLSLVEKLPLCLNEHS